MRTGAGRMRGTMDASPSTIRALKSVKSATPKSGQASAAAYSNSNSRRCLAERFCAEPCNSPGMVDGHGASLAGEGYGLAKVDLVETLGNGSAEVAVGMVIEDLAAMRAGDHEQWTILLAAIIEQHTDGQDVVIGVGIEGPVLMPFDGSAKACRLHVELRAVQADVGTEQAGEHLP